MISPTKLKTNSKHQHTWMRKFRDSRSARRSIINYNMPATIFRQFEFWIVFISSRLQIYIYTSCMPKSWLLFMYLPIFMRTRVFLCIYHIFWEHLKGMRSPKHGIRKTSFLSPSPPPFNMNNTEQVWQLYKYTQLFVSSFHTINCALVEG